ncbi:PadR family transcriptional regulator [Psychrobacillus sp.]|uniref:PadR family transcriptional regulator n=1 Tax=Psychrobacillus sp. TaxID=1871623 RepID=UPI0028BD28FB|nr:PadR family transcriptional regulator [Psychrobacillus sp.]
MSLKFGMLGLLSKWEATGYDIKKEFDSFMSIFWHTHLSQIYPELNKLEKENLIESRMILQEGKPDKKLYSITDAGKKELSHWLEKPPETPNVKDSFLMQAFFMDNLSAKDVLFQLKHYQKQREARLEKLKQTLYEQWQQIKEKNKLTTRLLMSSAVLKRGLEQEAEYIEWCKRTIVLVETFEHVWDSKLDNDGTTTIDEVKDIFYEYFDIEDEESLKN